MKQNYYGILRSVMFSASVLFAPIIISSPAFAEPPAQVGVQVPGFYRMQLGEFEVTALYDGYVSIDQKILKGASEKDIQSLLARMFLSTTEGTQTTVNAYLINTKTNLVLVDTGAAKCFGPTLGVIGDNIQAAGYKSEQIDMVLLTHLHGDHACGLATSDGKMAFPNAKIKVAKTEADYWLSEATMEKAPDDFKPVFKVLRDTIEPYIKAGTFSTYDPGENLLPGVTVAPSPGHTPGHAGYLFESQGKRLLVWGDIVHSHAVQFIRPEVSLEFDIDSVQAIETRKKIFEEVAREKLWVAGAHLPFPGLGHVRKDAEGYAWVPVEYAPVK